MSWYERTPKDTVTFSFTFDCYEKGKFYEKGKL